MRARNFALSALPVLAVVFTACSDPAVSPASRILPEAVVAPLAALSALPGSNTPSLIMSKLTADRCLNVKGALTADGTPLMVYKCYPSSTNEQFTWNGSAELRVFGSKCLAVKGGARMISTPVSFLAREANSRTNAADSCSVLCIFQFAANTGMRMTGGYRR